MTKMEFLKKLRKKIAFLPKSDKTERLSFYSEMIDDRIEDGVSEESAVDGIGDIEDVVNQIKGDAPEVIKAKRQLKAWEIVLIVLGSPLWLALLISAFAVIISVYAAQLSVIVSFYAVDLAFAVGVPFCIIQALLFFIGGNTAGGVFFIGGIFIVFALTGLTWFMCKPLTKAILKLTKKFMAWLKTLFIKKEN